MPARMPSDRPTSGAPAATVAALAAIPGRAPGSDAERRAALALADRLRAAGRSPELEAAWVRPQWALAHGVGLGLAVAGSLVAADAPWPGFALVFAALAGLGLDLAGRAYPLRLLTQRRATQNVVAADPRGAHPDRPVTLILTAGYDAGRLGLGYRPTVRAVADRLPRPYLLAIVLLGLLLVLVAARAIQSAPPDWLGVAQIVPTALLAVGAVVLFDIALAPTGPAANDNGSGVAAVLALAAELDARPPRALGVEVVLAGAGEGPALGVRAYVRARRRTVAPEAVAVLNVAACGRGSIRWWTSDGPLLPLPFHPALIAACATAAAERPEADAAPLRGRGTSGARPARVARWPAITVGCVGERGYPPASHTRRDTVDAVDAATIDGTVAFCAAAVRALDASLSPNAPPR